MIHDPALVKLGKRPPKNDPRTLRAERYFTPDLPPAPAALDLAPFRTAPWGMLGNDNAGDCTMAAGAHEFMAWVADATGGSSQLAISAAQVLQAYSDLTGYNPRDPSTDVGATCEDALSYLRNRGIAGHQIGAYARVKPRDHDLMRKALYLFGTVYLGVSLAVEQQDQQTWDYQPGSQPGSWGGHAIPIIAYDASGVVVITWGGLKRCTWQFLDHQCDEAYAVYGKDWLTGDKSMQGFDSAALLADLAAISGQPVPDPGPTPGPTPPPPGPMPPFPWCCPWRWLPWLWRALLGGR